jgi:hypothetical protein
MITPLHLLQLAGIGHFGILIASFQVPRIFDWQRELAPLHPFLRRLFWVYGLFIVLTIASFGVLTLVNVEALAAGDPVARSLAVFIALFWALRLAVQWFVFDARPFLTSRWRWLGYQTLAGAFVYFIAVFGAAALHRWPC